MYIKIFSLTVQARATLQNSPYSKRSTCFTFNIVTLSLVSINVLQAPKVAHSETTAELQIWRFSYIFDLSSKFLSPSKALEAFKVSHSTGIIAEQKISKSNFCSKYHFKWHFRLPEGQSNQSSSFLIFDMFDLPSKFSCLSQALKASKVNPSAVITAEQTISKSNFAQNITSNDILRLPESQHNQSSSFSIFDTFDLPSKFLCLGKPVEASKVSPSVVNTAEQKISKSTFAQNITSNVIFRLPEGQITYSSSFSIFDFFLPSKLFVHQ